MKLAKDLPASQMAQFGIHMGLKQVDVINVLTDPSCFSPVFKSFQVSICFDLYIMHTRKMFEMIN